MMKIKKLAVLGAGKMGETLVAGMLDSAIFTREQIMVTVKHAGTLGCPA